ncbi:hypothetical protein CO180_00355 [candidate division WWE3 bacterium CG_4_9_14_3_um_filter_41_6]|uniref:Methyltransferase type 11 domain-containing protein n=1 Tax=candidate division WWE3 bacterium CG_4_10_14_0_2_um_filter_41_14 TaxID=1975072 RepID=A0A2M7TEQ9_UNCKA|nr:MAG: hypothetical protein COY32_06880 [candidate division WWE3 bacterium CG_4_10_14_0_2_um_filter_41_14]PJA39578.1 MAG: hypothetical protein CO180_00355 [candidate division WWE3 bacterium CG_4_9_14_3_um_filter_41_6]
MQQKNYNPEEFKADITSVVEKENLRSINLGCGWDLFPKNWLHIGLFEDNRIPYGSVRKINGGYVAHYDIREGLPFSENSIQYIYGSHVIEHFSLQEGIDLFAECHRIMRSGGAIRMITPDLEIWIGNYRENNRQYFDRFYELHKSFPDLRTNGEILVGQIQGWGHKWLYDYDSLHDVMGRVGFANIKKKTHYESVIPDLESVEPSVELRTMESLYIEGEKVS